MSVVSSWTCGTCEIRFSWYSLHLVYQSSEVVIFIPFSQDFIVILSAALTLLGLIVLPGILSFLQVLEQEQNFDVSGTCFIVLVAWHFTFLVR